jgi:hypothetical protein
MIDYNTYDGLPLVLTLKPNEMGPLEVPHWSRKRLRRTQSKNSLRIERKDYHYPYLISLR